MRTIIKCHTLFDITSTGITNRKPPIDLTEDKQYTWTLNRNRQNNFDTLVQVVSLRTQPEDISKSSEREIDFSVPNKFGFLFENEEPQKVWSFTFSINYNNVYDDGIDELGALYTDCDGVPMLKVGTEWDKLPSFLDVSPELRNVYFEVISNE